MLHRFNDPERGVAGHDPATLAALLAYLRKCRVTIVPVDAQVRVALGLTDSLNAGPTVSFTIDDGYCDVAEIAAPVFAAFDVPFTLFVVPSVIDERRMYWWDQLQWILSQPEACHATVHLEQPQISVAWADTPGRIRAQRKLMLSFKELSPEERDSSLVVLAEQLGVEVPAIAPTAFEVLDWDRLRHLERQGASIGAHTMTHPILSRCDDQRARWEITASLKRVRAEFSRPSEVFCYPNGLPGDHGEREATILEDCGALAAVTAVHGLFSSGRSLTENGQRWTLPRMAYDARPGALFRAFFD